MRTYASNRNDHEQSNCVFIAAGFTGPGKPRVGRDSGVRPPRYCVLDYDYSAWEFFFRAGFSGFSALVRWRYKTTVYSAGTNLRIGLSETVELQVGTALFNHQKAEVSGVSESVNGRGDSSLAVKVALPSSSKTFSWAVLGSVGFATGEDPFTAGERQYDLGTTLNFNVNDSYSTAFYVNVTRFERENTYTFSPSLSFAVTDTVGAYVEAGVSHMKQSPNSAVAGGGITWMVTPAVQLDVSADFGLNSASLDIQGGLGISVFIK